MMNSDLSYKARTASRRKRSITRRYVLSACVTLSVGLCAEHLYDQRLLARQVPTLGSVQSLVPSVPLPRPHEPFSSPRTRIVWADETTLIRSMFWCDDWRNSSSSQISLTIDRYNRRISPHLTTLTKIPWPFPRQFLPAAHED